jgi:hypothetical protein
MAYKILDNTLSNQLQRISKQEYNSINTRSLFSINSMGGEGAKWALAYIHNEWEELLTGIGHLLYNF